MMWKSVIRPVYRRTIHRLTVPSLNVYGRCLSTQPGTGVPYETLQGKTKGGPDSVPTSADAVIIGGGVIGCATMYYLTKLGLNNVVLLERDEITSGTTWHTAGLVWRLRPSDTDIQLLNTSRSLMKSLEEETGVNSGWIENGGLFISSTKERLDEYKRLMTIGKVYGVESHVLGPEETKKLYPLMNVDDIYGTLYSPGDGTIDPAGYCMALTRAASKRGGQVITKCPVVDVHTSVDDFGVKRVSGVQTNVGTIKTGHVINCAGVWAPHIGEMCGVSVPQIAMRHAYVVTERIEGIQNMPNVRDHDASLYLKLQGDTLQVGGYEPNPIFWDEVKHDFAFSLFDLDWDVFSVHIDGAVNRCPVIGETGVRSTVCGPESFTPDHKPLLGESPELRGFFLGCAFNSLGMNLSSGCARELAHWVIDGRPQMDMYNYDIRRFTEKLTNNAKWIKDRSHEAYAKNYSIVYPYDEPLAYRNARLDPLHEVLLSAGCVFQERQGWERPGWFSTDGLPATIPEYDFYGAYDCKVNDPNQYYDKLKMDYTFDFPAHHHIIGEEALACRNKVAVFDMSYFTQFYLTGPDVGALADWIFSNNMDKPVGSTIYTCMLNKRGGVESDLTVSVVGPGNGAPHFEGSGYYVTVGGAAGQHNLSWIRNVIQDRKLNVKVTDCSEDMGLLSIQGPHSRSLMQDISDANFTNEAFPFSTNQVITVAGHTVRALRLSFVGEMGWELHAPNAALVDIYNALTTVGEKYSLRNAGYRAMDSLSTEKGYHHWHGDIRSEDTPLEGGLGFTCKLKTDVPFLGRDALLDQKRQGVKKRRACFTIDEKIPLLGYEVIWRDGQVVGFLRSAEYGFHINRSIGYGYVKNPSGEAITTNFLKTGTYELERMGDKYAATLHLKTPFDPSHQRLQGIYD